MAPKPAILVNFETVLNQPEAHSNEPRTKTQVLKNDDFDLAKKKSREKISKNPSSSGATSQDLSLLQKQNSFIFELQKSIQREERYPLQAKKRRIEEVIMVQFQLDENGKITEISLISEPKSKILGEAAIDAVKAASPFSPPPAGISKDFRIPIEFKIK